VKRERERDGQKGVSESSFLHVLIKSFTLFQSFSGLRLHVVTWRDTNFSEDHAASVFQDGGILTHRYMTSQSERPGLSSSSP